MANDVSVGLRVEGDASSAVAALQRVEKEVATLKQSTAGAGNAADATARNFTKLRGPLTSVANGVLQLSPGLATLGTTLASFTASGPIVAGAIAGIAAVGLAWRKLRDDANDAKEAQQQAISAATRIRNAQAGPQADIAGPLATVRSRLDVINPDIDRLQRLRDIGLATAESSNGRKLDRLLQERRQLSSALTTFEQQTNQNLMAGQGTLDPLEITVKSGATRRAEQRAAEERRRQQDQADLHLRIQRDMQAGREERERALRQAAEVRRTLNTQPELLANPSDLLMGIDPAMAMAAARQAKAKKGFNRDAAISAGISGLTSLASGADPMQSLFGTAAGVASAIPGWGMAASAGIGLLGAIIGNSHQREEEQYRAHLRALRDAREQDVVINVHLPSGQFYDTNSTDFQEALMETIENATGNRIGRVKVSRN